jgi:F0F1-type ATP synthase assembly protein I
MNGLGLNESEERPENTGSDEPRPEDPVFSASAYQPESSAESARNMGLGYAAGITFFATIAFMLFIGWGADLLLGSKPWGMVGGIVLGSIIAFIQFFRITSRIYNKPKDDPAINPLTASRDDDEPL